MFVRMERIGIAEFVAEQILTNGVSRFALERQIEIVSFLPKVYSARQEPEMFVQRAFFLGSRECEPNRASSNSTSSLEPT